MKFLRQNKVFYFVELVLCGFGAYFLTLVINEITLSTALQRVCIYGYFFVIIFGISCLLKDKIFFVFRRYKKTTFAVIILVCAWIVATNVRYLPQNYDENVIKISIQDEKNIESQGKEVWLKGVSIDGEKLPLEITKFYNSGWILEGEALHGEYSTVKELEFVLPKGRVVEMTFGKHAWSGIVEVTNNGNVNRYDLYSEKGDELRILFSGKYTEYTGVVQMILFFGYSSLCIMLGIWIMVFIEQKYWGNNKKDFRERS